MSVRIGQKLDDYVAERLISLGKEEVLSIHDIEALDGKRRRDAASAQQPIHALKRRRCSR